MNFEQAYENYKKGTASDEEKAYVEMEIDKARKLTELIDSQDAEKCCLAAADEEDVVKAQKTYTKRTILRNVIISAAVVIVLAGIVCASVFGTATSAAKKKTAYTITEAEAIALSFMAARPNIVPDNLLVSERERDLRIEGTLKASYYYYKIEINNLATGDEIDVYVNAHTGEASFISPE